jgi:hypothetical protein
MNATRTVPAVVLSFVVAAILNLKMDATRNHNLGYI